MFSSWSPVISRSGRNVLLSAWLAVAPFALSAPDEARLEPLARLIQDSTPRVRLEALRSLAKIHSAKSAELALSVLDRPMDSTLDYALWLTINDLADPWIAALESGAWSPAGREKQLEFALKAINVSPRLIRSANGASARATKSVGNKPAGESHCPTLSNQEYAFCSLKKTGEPMVQMPTIFGVTAAEANPSRPPSEWPTQSTRSFFECEYTVSRIAGMS